jgi:hypothetical protein
MMMDVASTSETLSSTRLHGADTSEHSRVHIQQVFSKDKFLHILSLFLPRLESSVSHDPLFNQPNTIM